MPYDTCINVITIYITRYCGAHNAHTTLHINNTAGFIFTPNWALALGGLNAAKNYLNRTPFVFRPLQLVVGFGVTAI